MRWMKRGGAADLMVLSSFLWFWLLDDGQLFEGVVWNSLIISSLEGHDSCGNVESLNESLLLLSGCDSVSA